MSTAPSSAPAEGAWTQRGGGDRACHLSSEVGEAKETLETSYEGPDVTIGFNAQYIQDFLGVAGEGDVTFEFKDGQSQAQLRPVGTPEYDYRYVVMPMRL
jgi:DNA polymerase III subunit beta